MTRDEAIKIFENCHNNNTPNWAPRWIDAFAELGMLKLDEAAGPTLWTILRKHGVALDVAQWVCNDAMSAGLKIVETK